jgi:hypothetical protein
MIGRATGRGGLAGLPCGFLTQGAWFVVTGEIAAQILPNVLHDQVEVCEDSEADGPVRAMPAAEKSWSLAQFRGEALEEILAPIIERKIAERRALDQEREREATEKLREHVRVQAKRKAAAAEAKRKAMAVELALAETDAKKAADAAERAVNEPLSAPVTADLSMADQIANARAAREAAKNAPPVAPAPPMGRVTGHALKGVQT